MLTYFLIGAIWSMWLEYYTTKNLEGAYGSPWVFLEGVFHITLWPVSLIVFIYAFIQEVNRRNKF